MSDVTVTLTVPQLAKAKASVRSRAGAENESSDDQLLVEYIINQIAGIVDYDAEQKARSEITRFRP